MSDIESDWEGEDELGERPYGGRPYGGRPYGGKPYGGRPYGGKPFGGRPYGGRPYGGRPYGGRPYGGKPYGGRPYGGKPYGGKPYGGRSPGDGLDLDEWSADIGELFCDRSALVQLGATVVPVEDQLWVPTFGPFAGFRPTPPTAAVGTLELEPCDNTIEVSVALRSALFSHVADDPGLGGIVKADLAEALVGAADAAFLGPNPPLPGISTRGAIQAVTVPNDLLATVRAAAQMVLAAVPPPSGRNPGWILHPLTVDRLSRTRTANGMNDSTLASAPTLAEFDLFRLDSAQQGTLLGVPFVTSGAAVAAPGSPRIFVAADWDEAWIGIDPSFISVDLPASAALAAIAALDGSKVVRVSMPIDFDLRRQGVFAWVDSP